MMASDGGGGGAEGAKFVTIEPKREGFKAAFVLPVTRDGMALLTRERKGKIVKFGMLGGKRAGGETDLECMAREAEEETGGALSEVTLGRMRGGRGVRRSVEGTDRVEYERAEAVCVCHDLVVGKDKDVDARVDPKRVASMRSDAGGGGGGGGCGVGKKRKKRSEVEGAEFVPVSKLKSWEWRNENMHHVASVFAARMAGCL